MKEIRFSVVAVLFLVFALVGCAGTKAELTKLDGYDVVQGERTGAFGTDNSFVLVVPKPKAVRTVVPKTVVRTIEPAKVVKLERSYKKSAISWTGCKDKKPNKNAKNIKREEIGESWTEDAIIPAVTETEQVEEVVVSIPQQTQPLFWAGGNPSTGNGAVSAAFQATGIALGAALLRPDINKTNITTSSAGGAGGVGEGGIGQGGAGGSGGIGQGGAGYGYGGAGGAGGSSSSSSSSSSAAAAEATASAAAAAAAAAAAE